MDKMAQFKELLNKLEDGDSKTELLTAFSNLSTDVTTTVDKLKGERKDVGTKLDGALGFKKSILESLGLDETATTEDIQKAINSDEKTQKLLEAEKLKYNKDTTDLRNLLDTSKSEAESFKSKLNNFEKQSLLEKEGMYKDVLPEAKSFYDMEIAEKVMVKDGKLYVKDSNGEIARDLTSNEPLSIESLRENIINTKPFLFTEVNKGNGGTTPPSQASGNYGAKKFSDLTSEEMVTLRRNNPAEYDRLKNQ